MTSIAHLGPSGSYSELAAVTYARWLETKTSCELDFQPHTTIVKAISAVASGAADISVVPVENSIGGSVTDTLDMMWEFENLNIHNNLVLPIHHALLSFTAELGQISTVYSHPQALAQCQKWLSVNLPQATQIATSSTTEALPHLAGQVDTAAIAPLRAAHLYSIPVLAEAINDHVDNETRFWVLGRSPSIQGCHTSLAFSLPENTPGALLKPLQLFATQEINMSRIESRPTKQILGEYRFFIDIEASLENPSTKAAMQLLKNCTKVLKVFGSYSPVPVEA